tara:strand:- start:272 stop:616 length:345 start_codon:yes stop_codon:yes gene_type:complete
MKFDFAKATDITEFAKRELPEMYDQYKKVFITPDVTDYHILRVLEGFGEDYEEEEGSFILEHNMIPKPKRESIRGVIHLKQILEEDDGGNWDFGVFGSLEEAIEEVDGGHGINN